MQFRLFAVQTGVALCLLAVLACTDARAQDRTLMLIANPQGAPEAIQFDKVRDIFKAQNQRWGNGTKITLAMVKSSNPLAEVVADKVYGMDIDGVKKYWVQIVFRGKASTPKYFDTEDEVKHYVAQTPGAIGIVGSGPLNSPTRIVQVDGKRSW